MGEYRGADRRTRVIRQEMVESGLIDTFKEKRAGPRIEYAENRILVILNLMPRYAAHVKMGLERRHFFDGTNQRRIPGASKWFQTVAPEPLDNFLFLGIRAQPEKKPFGPRLPEYIQYVQEIRPGNRGPAPEEKYAVSIRRWIRR